ncbi:hypothetical protein A2801_03945 [Candidatus Woesebacteria bacterium RIFCSPHIGHO2_01_FULL_41_10]|uniref:N-acetyltransferase domain-containing protein n=1 Tax=Candidatus Woesebacteria bacterium RIFCSPHIGHO2_01_FULL_41_10 TaxID=1802500 RepID=A0A1F7YQ70_9BACT|nr:MAG: hypothetical protein A2801_03945 [Candidatus Woesebacteria bacterium RIFCSPHIGHO2_01_FULL_41_10]
MVEYEVLFSGASCEQMNDDSLSAAIFTGDSLENNVAQLSEIVASLASDGFGEGKVMSPERMEGRLLREGNLIIALDQDSVPVGFQMQTVFSEGEEDFLYYSRVVRKDQQGKGIGGKLLRVATSLYKPTVVAARSQNPVEISSFLREMESLNVGGVYPFNFPYDSNPRAQESLRVLVSKLGYLGKTDLETGLCRGAYSEGRLGDYEIRTDHPRIQKVEQDLVRFGLDRQGGDAIFYLALVR